MLWKLNIVITEFNVIHLIVSVGLLDEYLRQLEALHLFVRSLQVIEIFPEEMEEAGRGRG